MPVHAYMHSRLMEESEARIEMAACFDSPADTLVADRILRNPDAYRRWEAEHDRLMRAVSEQARLARQVVALRSTAFGLIHRKATFEYLRDRQITGARRHRLIAQFYGVRDYANAVVAEHGNYARCSSSYLCTYHLAERLMQDAAFDEPLRLYEQWYSEYFQTYCDVALAQTVEETGLRLLQEQKPDRRLYTNVEFYSAVVLHAVGLARDLFTPTFAASRTVGWTAHILEQYANNKLIRPRADYTGAQNLEFVPMEKR